MGLFIILPTHPNLYTLMVNNFMEFFVGMPIIFTKKCTSKSLAGKGGIVTEIRSGLEYPIFVQIVIDAKKYVYGFSRAEVTPRCPN
jgi:hypothetical protein